MTTEILVGPCINCGKTVAGTRFGYRHVGADRDNAYFCHGDKALSELEHAAIDYSYLDSETCEF